MSALKNAEDIAETEDYNMASNSVRSFICENCGVLSVGVMTAKKYHTKGLYCSERCKLEATLKEKILSTEDNTLEYPDNELCRCKQCGYPVGVQTAPTTTYASEGFCSQKCYNIAHVGEGKKKICVRCKEAFTTNGGAKICQSCKQKHMPAGYTPLEHGIQKDKRMHETQISKMSVEEYTEYQFRAHEKRAHKFGYFEHVCELTSTEWSHILYLQGGKCRGCGQSFDENHIATLDHIYPISNGGNTTFTNAQALCKRCNSIKHCKENSAFLNNLI